MQLKIARNQKSGLMGRNVIFALDARAEFTPEEESSIKKYHLGSQIVYSSEAFKNSVNTMLDVGRGIGNPLAGFAAMARSKLALKVTIDDLKKGVHLELKDLSEAIGAEEAIIAGCKAAKEFIDAAGFFDGREEIIDIDSVE